MHPLLLPKSRPSSFRSLSIPAFRIIPFVILTLFTFTMPLMAQDDLQPVPQIHSITVRLADGSVVECGPANDGSGEFEVLNPDATAASSATSSFISQGRFGVILAAFGFLAQVIFMSRFLVQWLASEKAKKSVIPVTFWWLSISGATMLLIYFILRHEPIGILGQSFGWIVYSRNLYLIYRPHPSTVE